MRENDFFYPEFQLIIRLLRLREANEPNKYGFFLNFFDLSDKKW